MKKMLLLSALSTLLFVTACRKDIAPPTDAAGVNTTIVKQDTDKGDWRTAYYRGSLIHYQRINGKNIWDGDMIIPDSQLSATPQSEIGVSAVGTNHLDSLWPDATMPYLIDASLSAAGRASMRAAMDDWTSATGFTFVEISNGAYPPHYLTIRQEPGGNNSSASVGMNARTNDSNLIIIANGFDRYKGIAAHELGHAMGLHHEHLRADRDAHINIYLGNILPDYQAGFVNPYSNGDYAGTPFDFNSIMLYGSFTAAVEPNNPDRPAMNRLDRSTWIYNAEEGGTQRCSAGDADWVQRKYGIGNNIVAGKTYYIRSYSDNNKVIDVQGGASSNGTPLWLWGHNYSNAQKWTFTFVDHGYYKIESAVAPGKVLDISGGQTANGTQMQIWDWANVPQQKWQVLSVGGGYYKLIPVLSGVKALDLEYGSTAERTKIQLWDDNNTDAQKWKIEEAYF